MTRRRIILAALALLLAAFVIAVQRDTFVRRWCLPTPPPATRPLGPLDQVIDEFEIDDASAAEKVREFERRSGVLTRATVFRSHAYSWADEPQQRCTIRRATVEQLLCRIFCSRYLLGDPIAMDADGSVTLDERNGRISPTMARIHAPDRALLQHNVRLTNRWNRPGPRVDLIRHLELFTLHRVASRSTGFDPILRFGDKLIAVTTARNHWLIDQILREEADAQQAKLAQPAATLPAR